MIVLRSLVVTLFLSLLIALPAQDNYLSTKKKDYLVTLSTRYGEMVLILYDATPEHKQNFLKLAAEGYYDSTTFHRIIKDFMIQGGDPNTRPGGNMALAGQGGPDYTLPAEILPGAIHRKGVLAAARQGDQVNPERRSSGSQFYIVQGKKLTENELQMMEARLRQSLGPKYQMDENTKTLYRDLGGAPWLDEQYSIFGEVIRGMEVIDSLATVPTSARSVPQEPLYIKMEVDKVRKKKITKRYGFEFHARKESEE